MSDQTPGATGPDQPVDPFAAKPPGTPPTPPVPPAPAGFPPPPPAAPPVPQGGTPADVPPPVPPQPPTPPVASGPPAMSPPPAQPYGAPAGYGQPGYGMPPGGVAPDNYLVWSILATVLCCLPLGIVSIVYASQVNTKWAMGDLAGAQESSRKAKQFAIWSLAAALIGSVLWFILIGCALLTGSTSTV